MRRIAGALSRTYHHSDIEQTLQETLQKISAANGIPAHLQVHRRACPCPQTCKIQVLHVLQEALNVRKHARASRVSLTMHKRAHCGALKCTTMASDSTHSNSQTSRM